MKYTRVDFEKRISQHKKNISKLESARDVVAGLLDLLDGSISYNDATVLRRSIQSEIDSLVSKVTELHLIMAERFGEN